ncbi:MAG: hypothetical protein NTY19_37115 [Planctomycetota bacterium]|nr:hypothetical protein [Planctomycetota bacterium]
MNRTRESFFVPISLLAAIGIYLLLACATSWFPWDTSTQAELFLPLARESLHPEPQERFLYLLGLACIPTLPLAVFVSLYYLDRRSRLKLPRFGDAADLTALGRRRDLLLVTILVLWLTVMVAWTELNRGVLFGAFGGALAVPWLVRCKCSVHSYLVHSLAAVLLLFLAYVLVFTEHRLWYAPASPSAGWYWQHHFDLLVGAINQVHHGKTVLVDTSSQYGIFYPYVGAVFARLFGMSVLTATLFFVLLSLLSLWFVYLAILRKFGAGSAALVVLAAVLGLFHPFCVWSVEPIYYYQYFPLRVVCGAFFLWFVPYYLDRRSWQRAAVGFLAAGFSVLWNADTGLVILIAWTATLFYASLNDVRGGWEVARSVVKHLLWFAATLGISVAGYGLFAWARSGQIPSLESYSRYQRIFYGNGFCLSPMNPREFWQPVILVYVATVFFCLRQLWKRRATSTCSWYLFVALYGLGIFTYYQARSHVHGLGNVCYPSVILSCFLFWDCLHQVRTWDWRKTARSPLLRYNWLRLSLFSLLPLFGLICFTRAVVPAIRLAGETTRSLTVQEEDPAIVELGRQISGTELLICYHAANYLHIKTHSWSALPVASTTEVVLQDQLRDIQRLIDEKRYRVLMGRPIASLYTDKIGGYLDLTGYRPIFEGEHFVLFEPAPSPWYSGERVGVRGGAERQMPKCFLCRSLVHRRQRQVPVPSVRPSHLTLRVAEFARILAVSPCGSYSASARNLAISPTSRQNSQLQRRGPVAMVLVEAVGPGPAAPPGNFGSGASTSHPLDIQTLEQ